MRSDVEYLSSLDQITVKVQLILTGNHVGLALVAATIVDVGGEVHSDPVSHCWPVRPAIMTWHLPHEGSSTDRLATPPVSDGSELDLIPLQTAYFATGVQLYSKIHE